MRGDNALLRLRTLLSTRSDLALAAAGLRSALNAWPRPVPSDVMDAFAHVTRAYAAPAPAAFTKRAAAPKKGKTTADGSLTPRMKMVIDMLLPPQYQTGAPGVPVRSLPVGEKLVAKGGEAPSRWDKWVQAVTARKAAEGSEAMRKWERWVQKVEAARGERAARRTFNEQGEPYHKMMARMHAEWEQDMIMKHQLQRAALRALPKELRELAEQPDMAPFPPDRQFLLQTPPKTYGATADEAEVQAPERSRK